MTSTKSFGIPWLSPENKPSSRTSPLRRFSLSNSPMVDLDKDQIQQCLINLILNGIDATDPGGKIRFASRMVPEKQAVEITVSDTGRGIPERALDRVFEPFFTTKETGTGLGLAITHGIIQQHGGSIEVESKEGEGTTFRIHLPISKGDEDAR